MNITKQEVDKLFDEFQLIADIRHLIIQLKNSGLSIDKQLELINLATDLDLPNMRETLIKVSDAVSLSENKEHFA